MARRAGETAQLVSVKADLVGRNRLNRQIEVARGERVDVGRACQAA